MDIRFENLKKEYDGRQVVDIESGEIGGPGCFAVIGPNGAGKTTLLNLIAGLDAPTGGKLLFQTTSGWSRKTPYQDMTLVFQKPYLLHTTVENNIRYPMKIRKWPTEKIDARTAELLKMFGLTAFAKQKAWTLSGGEMQKAALARALSFRPKLLLLDEPTASVDPATTADIEEILRKVETKIIIVTHNLAQVNRLCSDVLFMHGGTIIEQGKTEKLLKNPKFDATKKFIAGELLI